MDQQNRFPRNRHMVVKSLIPQIQNWMSEDDLGRNHYYLRSLPHTPVEVELKIKSDLILCGLDYLEATFQYLGFQEDFSFLDDVEGVHFSREVSFSLPSCAHYSGDNINIKFPFKMPFNILLTGERLALNLVQHASSISTWTYQYVKLARPYEIKILDTRKTTPGLRSLEKYAVRMGGGMNHRLGQTDTWMIKDNHKNCLGGLENAWNFFTSQGACYNNIVVEVHSLNELTEAIDLGARYVMLDNFSPDDIKQAIEVKKNAHQHDLHLEVSGGIKMDNIKSYLIQGVDAISLGSLTYGAPRVDLSLKYRP